MNIGKGWERRMDEIMRKESGWKNQKEEWMKEWKRRMNERMRKENGWRNEKGEWVKEWERQLWERKKTNEAKWERDRRTRKQFIQKQLGMFPFVSHHRHPFRRRGCPRLPEAEIRGWWMSIVKMFAANHQSCEPFTAKAFSPPLLKKTGKELFSLLLPSSFWTCGPDQ